MLTENSRFARNMDRGTEWWDFENGVLGFDGEGHAKGWTMVAGLKGVGVDCILWSSLSGIAS
jgi:hypothetical protein